MLLAQAESTLVLPRVDWVSVAPATILIGAAFVLLVAGSLLRGRLPKPTNVTVTIAAAVAAMFSTIPLWDRVREGRAAATLADAVQVDGFGVFFVITICTALVLSALIGEGFFVRENLPGPEYNVLMLLSASGGIIMATANDLIVLFLGLEILSIALYVLAGSNVRKVESQESALKYFVLGAFSSAVLLYGIALVYGAVGTTNLTGISTYLGDRVIFGNSLLVGGMVLLLVGLGFKVAAVPFHMWTPDVYQGAPSPITGFMAATAKAAGFAALLRVFVSALGSRGTDWQPVVWVLAVITMVVGAILAVVQSDVKRMMAYSSISHAGFIMIGLEAASHRTGASGISGSLFYLLAYTFIVLGTFAVITIVGGQGDSAHRLDDYNGLARRKPALALAFTLFLLAQAGIPATSGFIAKFGVINAAVQVHSYAIAIVAMLTGVITASFYLRLIMRMYTAEPGEGAVAVRIPMGATIALVLCSAATLFGGLLPQVVVEFAQKATLR